MGEWESDLDKCWCCFSQKCTVVVFIYMYVFRDVLSMSRVLYMSCWMVPATANRHMSQPCSYYLFLPHLYCSFVTPKMRIFFQCSNSTPMVMVFCRYAQIKCPDLSTT
jgi:hypothetical protein